MERLDDDTWNVTMELLELPRIPNSHDVKDSDESKLDATGELRSYCRIRGYARGQPQQVYEIGADDGQRIEHRDLDADG